MKVKNMLILGNAEDVSADGISNPLDEDSTSCTYGWNSADGEMDGIFNPLDEDSMSCTCGWNSTDGEMSSCSCDGNQTDRYLVRCTVCGRHKRDQEMPFCTCDGNQRDGVFDSEQKASPESQPADVKERRNTIPWGKAALGVGIALCVIPTAIPMMVTVAGFEAGGIVAGSTAASFMASYGGAVAPGSLCAVLQSIGATGAITGGTTISSLGVGSTAAGLASCEGVRQGATSAVKSLQAASFSAINTLRAKARGKAK